MESHPPSLLSSICCLHWAQSCNGVLSSGAGKRLFCLTNLWRQLANILCEVQSYILMQCRIWNIGNLKLKASQGVSLPHTQVPSFEPLLQPVSPYFYADCDVSSLPLILLPLSRRSLPLFHLFCLPATSAFPVPEAPFGCSCLDMQPKGGKILPQVNHIKTLQMILQTAE